MRPTLPRLCDAWHADNCINSTKEASAKRLSKTAQQRDMTCLSDLSTGHNPAMPSATGQLSQVAQPLGTQLQASGLTSKQRLADQQWLQSLVHLLPGRHPTVAELLWISNSTAAVIHKHRKVRHRIALLINSGCYAFYACHKAGIPLLLV